MKHSILFAASFAALTLAGCNEQTPATDSTADTAAADATMSAAPTAESPAQEFANAAAASDMFEIESSRLAASKATASEIRTFAESMIKAHTDSTAKLKTATAAASPAISPVAAMTELQRQVLTDLGSKTGAEFDAAYAKAQVDAHQMTLGKLKAYSADGEVASLKAFATELVPIVTAHLNMAKGLKTS